MIFFINFYKRTHYKLLYTSGDFEGPDSSVGPDPSK